MKYKLYHYWRSSCSWRVRWALRLKDIPCEFIPVNLLTDEIESPEYLKRNPMGYVPALEVTDGTRVNVLCESIPIVEYLEETHSSYSLLPGDSLQRAKIRQLVETINAGTQPLQNLNVFQLHSSVPEEQKKWNQTWIRKGLHAYETIAKPVAGKFSVGDQVTLADLVLIPQCYNALRYEVSLSEFPLLDRIYKSALQTQACSDSAPEKFQPA